MIFFSYDKDRIGNDRDMLINIIPACLRVCPILNKVLASIDEHLSLASI